MKLLKLATRVVAAVALIASISGCVVVPVPYGHDSHHRYYDRR